MRYRYYESDWDCMLPDELTDEIVDLDKAHKRAKRALRQQQKAIDGKNATIKELELEIEALKEHLDWDEIMSLYNEEV